MIDVLVTERESSYPGAGIVARIGDSRDVSNYLVQAGNEFRRGNSNSYVTFFRGKKNSRGRKLLAELSKSIQDGYNASDTKVEDVPEGVLRILHSKILEIRSKGSAQEFFKGNKCRHHVVPLILNLGYAGDSILVQSRKKIVIPMGSQLEGRDGEEFNKDINARFKGAPISVFSVLANFTLEETGGKIGRWNRDTLASMNEKIFGEVVYQSLDEGDGVGVRWKAGIKVVEEAVLASVAQAKEDANPKSGNSEGSSFFEDVSDWLDSASDNIPFPG